MAACVCARGHFQRNGRPTTRTATTHVIHALLSNRCLARSLFKSSRSLPMDVEGFRGAVLLTKNFVDTPLRRAAGHDLFVCSGCAVTDGIFVQ